MLQVETNEKCVMVDRTLYSIPTDLYSEIVQKYGTFQHFYICLNESAAYKLWQKFNDTKKAVHVESVKTYN